MIANRDAVREKIAQGYGDYLAVEMPGAQVYGYMKSGFGGNSPVVRVVSDGSLRPEFPAQGVRSQFYYVVQHYVIYYQQGAPEVQAEAEDLLDQLEYHLYSWMVTNQQIPGFWTEIKFAERSRSSVVPVDSGAYYYILELIPLAVRVAG